MDRDIDLRGDARIVKDGTVLIDADGNIDAPVTTTNLTTSGNTTLGDTSADALSVPSTSTFTAPVTVGVDDTGHDVKMFGATSGSYLLWDESADQLKLVAASADVQGAVTIGVDDTGYDFKAFGATSGAYLLWDESEDTLKVAGGATVDLSGKLNLGLNGGAESASGLLAGVGTTANPATTAVADAKFIEIRSESTATSGDSRGLYWRHSLNGAGVSGEAIRAFSKVEAAAATTRGAHISLDVASGGSASGLGVGVDSQILVHDGALAGGTYAVSNLEAYSAGSSTDVSGVTEFSMIRMVAGGDATGAANVDDNAFAMTFSGFAAGSGNMIDTDITTHSAYGGLRVNIPGVGTKYIALVSD